MDNNKKNTYSEGFRQDKRYKTIDGISYCNFGELRIGYSLRHIFGNGNDGKRPGIGSKQPIPPIGQTATVDVMFAVDKILTGLEDEFGRI